MAGYELAINISDIMQKIRNTFGHLFKDINYIPYQGTVTEITTKLHQLLAHYQIDIATQTLFISSQAENCLSFVDAGCNFLRCTEAGEFNPLKLDYITRLVKSNRFDSNHWFLDFDSTLVLTGHSLVFADTVVQQDRKATPMLNHDLLIRLCKLNQENPDKNEWNLITARTYAKHDAGVLPLKYVLKEIRKTYSIKIAYSKASFTNYANTGNLKAPFIVWHAKILAKQNPNSKFLIIYIDDSDTELKFASIIEKMLPKNAGLVTLKIYTNGQFFEGAAAKFAAFLSKAHTRPKTNTSGLFHPRTEVNGNLNFVRLKQEHLGKN